MKIRDSAKSRVLDSIDSEIIEMLRSSGRATNQEIAERLSVTPATVSARLRRMEDSKAMRVVTVADFAAHDYKILIAIGIRVEGRNAADVARDLAKLPEVFSINLMCGPLDLELLVTLREFEESTFFSPIMSQRYLALASCIPASRSTSSNSNSVWHRCEQHSSR